MEDPERERPSKKVSGRKDLAARRCARTSSALGTLLERVEKRVAPRPQAREPRRLRAGAVDLRKHEKGTRRGG